MESNHSTPRIFFSTLRSADSGVQGETHNGTIRSDIQDKLFALVIRETRSGRYPPGNAAKTAVFSAFWKQWKRMS